MIENPDGKTSASLAISSPSFQLIPTSLAFPRILRRDVTLTTIHSFLESPREVTGEGSCADGGKKPTSGAISLELEQAEGNSQDKETQGQLEKLTLLHLALLSRKIP